MDARKQKRYGLSQFLAAAAFGVSAQCFCSFALTLLLPLFPETADRYREIMDNMEIGQGLVPLLYTGILAPIVEELIFRGLILGYGGRLLPFWIANLIQALLFGLYHQNVVQFVYAFFIGLLLGEIYRHMKALWIVMAIHGIINVSGNAIFFLKPDFLSAWKPGMYGGLLISLTVLLFSLWFLIGEKSQIDKRKNHEKGK